MNLHPTDRFEASRNGALRDLSAEQLLHLGVQRVVYLRAAVVDGERVFVMYGADGVPLVAVDTVATALEVAADRNLDFVPVH
ncbi:MAG TPA: DUF1150 family protein [Acetobacteraceae bacterium]|jgi:hypothetical protein|nr:DUF1150 family protein [Acetobacteraceae bacterium]